MKLVYIALLILEISIYALLSIEIDKYTLKNYFKILI